MMPKQLTLAGGWGLGGSASRGAGGCGCGCPLLSLLPLRCFIVAFAVPGLHVECASAIMQPMIPLPLAPQAG
jgi:hypothetical protein